MLIAVDVGNTQICIGLFDSDRLVGDIAFSTRDRMTADEARLMIGTVLANVRVPQDVIDGMVIGSVVPSLTGAFEHAGEFLLGHQALTVSSDIPLPLRLCHLDPGQVGPDRIANAVAAHARYPGPVVVIDFGTATTFDVISPEGDYLGGAIALGVETSASELARRAARLPQVELRMPMRTIGKTTEEAIRSGVLLGTVGQMKEIVSRIEQELGTECTVVLTGGLCHQMAELWERACHVDRELTLEGLRIVYEYVSGLKGESEGLS
jgi:type III pantothenate kinase